MIAKRAGPPPKKDDRRAANTTVHLEGNKGDWNSPNNTTKKQATEGSSVSEQLSLRAVRLRFRGGR